MQVMLEQSFRQRHASDSARKQAELRYRNRAAAKVLEIQASALQRAEEIHNKKRAIQLQIDAVMKLAGADERKEELEMANAAREEAERIQAEAKARARVAGEAQDIQNLESSAADKAFRMAQKAEEKLKMEVSYALKAYAEKVTQKNLKQTEVNKIQAFLSKESARAFEAQEQWKKLAGQRAQALASQILGAADLRARQQW